jgi:NTE family protein
MDVTLALGGGGTKGYAHIGVVRALEAHGINVRAIAGTSVGGLFGGIYAAGVSFEDLQYWIEKVDQNKLFSRMPGEGPGLMGVSGLTYILEELVGDKLLEELPIPMAMTGVDLETGEKVVIDRGRVLDAIQATIAIPGILPPKLIDGRLIIDGGVIDPVPVALARSLAPGLPVVAVVLSPGLKHWNGHYQPPSFMNSIPLINQFYKFRLAQSLNIFIRSMDIATCYLAEMTLETSKPEVVIRPDLGDIGIIDPVDIYSLVETGEQAATAALPAFRRLLPDKKNWSARLYDRMPWLADILGNPANNV